MNKKNGRAILVSIASIILLLGILWPIGTHMLEAIKPGLGKNSLKKDKQELTVILTEKFPEFSFAPTDADVWSNALIMEQIVGTLVKYGRNGNYEPFLAEKWEASSDEHQWRFHLRKDLKLDSGNEISAGKFIKSLKKMLHIYAASSTPPMFSKLEGWNDFAKGNDQALQINAEDNTDLPPKKWTRDLGCIC